MASLPLRIQTARNVGPLRGGEIAALQPASPAAQHGILPGDRLVAINGLVVRDVIDYQYESAGAVLDLLLERDGESLRPRIAKDSEQELGLSFSLPVFSGIRECNNHCEFCFIAGLPKGLRRSLYIRDDDYRYSFLFGTFLTLTNLEEADWQRIGYQRLSPLHVSVHATDLAVRRTMLSNPDAPDIRDQIERLGRMGIAIKAQVVLCPDINDGAVLEQTIRELADRAEVVDSVAVVPVGLTRYSRARRLRAVTRSEARAAIRSTSRWQRSLFPRLGRRFVYASDELYLLAGMALPGARGYDGFRQLQNGVGVMRLLLEEWRHVRREIPTRFDGKQRVAWVCGRAAAPALRQMADDIAATAGLSVDVLDVSNDFFGGGISVSGLLTGQDIVAALRRNPVNLAILPRSAFGYDGRETLDGFTPEAVEADTHVRLVLASSAQELLTATLSG